MKTIRKKQHSDLQGMRLLLISDTHGKLGSINALSSVRSPTRSSTPEISNFAMTTLMEPQQS